MTELDVVDQIKRSENVARLHMQGYSDNQIARQMDLRPKEVKIALSNWKALLREESSSATQIKDKVLDVLIEADQHWSLIAKEAWDTAEEAGGLGMLAQKINALKLVETVTKNRTSAFANAGVGQDTALVDEMNETQRRQDVLIQILIDVKARWPEASQYISKKLTEVTNEVIEVEVIDE